MLLRKITLLASPLLALSAYAQPEFIPRDISLTADFASSVFAADVDGDGDTDILSASFLDDAIRWYENNGLTPAGFTARDILLTADGAESVFAADVDGDGDMDVLSATLNESTIRWYENNGGSPPVFTPHDIFTTALTAVDVLAVDIDGDGDVDVVSASAGDDAVRWYENDGAVFPGFTARDITLSADGAIAVFAADIDGDSDMDVLSASRFDNAIRWYENDGGTPPVFTIHDITLTAMNARSVHAADIDGDGDTDVLSASEDDDAFRWYENDGGSPPVFTPHDISLSANGAMAIAAADIDADGDTDVIAASRFDDHVRWYENDGGNPPSFAVQTVFYSADNVNEICPADIDGDGDIDVVSSSGSDDAVRWYVSCGGAPSCRADLTTQGAGAGDPGFGVPDGQVTATDIQFYVNLFTAGCP